jgi:hypothetical protein
MLLDEASVTGTKQCNGSFLQRYNYNLQQHEPYFATAFEDVEFNGEQILLEGSNLTITGVKVKWM